MYPERWDPKKESFKEWTDEFLRWIRAEDGELEAYLRRHQFGKEALEMQSGPKANDVRIVHAHLKKLLTDPESKKILKTTLNEHGGEAWRRLMRRHNPRT